METFVLLIDLGLGELLSGKQLKNTSQKLRYKNPQLHPPSIKYSSWNIMAATAMR
jgi:hypothetical protein